MRKFALAWAGAALIPLLNAAPAAAQLDHTYVTQTGSGAVCSFAAPCNVVQTAISQTNAGGDVYILNGDYAENIIIDRSIGISGEPNANVIIRATTTNGTSTTVTVNAPNNASVSISNVAIYADLNGIQFNTGRRLTLNSSTSISGASNIGLNFVPNTPASGGNSTELNINNISVGGTNGNILIKPSGGVVVKSFMNNTRLRGGLYGLRVDDTGGSGKLRVDFQNGWSNEHTNNGFLAVDSGSGDLTLMVDHSTAFDNGAFGAVATGAQAAMIITDSTLVNNNTGLGQLGAAFVGTYSDNSLKFNSTSTSGTITPLTKQ